MPWWIVNQNSEGERRVQADEYVQDQDLIRFMADGETHVALPVRDVKSIERDYTQE